MDRILNDPRLVPIQGTFNWRVDAVFSVVDDVLGLINVPVGFVTDLGSIPKWLWGIVPPEGPATDGYVIHDFLYNTQACTRQQADDCLLRLMTVLGVGYVARYTVYWHLRAYGCSAWNTDAKKKVLTPPIA